MKITRRAARPHALAWALLLNALFLAAVLLCFHVYYEGNDDQAMLILLSGAYDAQATPFIVFIGMAVSWPLAKLAATWPGVPWYALFEYALAFASFTAASAVLIRRGRRRGLALSLLMLCAFGFECYTRMQFTKVAGIAVASGALAMTDALARRRPRVAAAAAGGLLMALGSAYRFRMLAPALALVLPAALFAAVRQWRRGSRASVLRLAGGLAAAAAVCVGLQLVSGAVYARDAEWSRYLRYNAARSQLLDLSFPDYEANAELYRSLDIAEADVDMYSHWDFSDPDRFNPDTVPLLAQARPAATIDAVDWRALAGEIPAGYLRYAWAPAVLIAAALAVYAARRNLAYVAGALAVLAALSAYLLFYGRYLVRRVDAGLFYALALSLLYIFQRSVRDPAPTARQCALCLCLAAALFAPTFVQYAQASAGDAAQIAQNRELGDLIAEDGDNVYLVSVLSADFMWNGFSMWEACPPEYSRNVCLLGGWSSYTPVWNEMNVRRGIENPFAWCIGNDRAYLLANSHLSAITGYLRRHFDPDAKVVLAKQINGTSIYRVVTGTPAPKIEGDIAEAPAARLRTEDVKYARDGRKLTVSGRVWIEGESSYLGEAWLELAGDDGMTAWHPMTQYEADGAAAGDAHGQFAKYAAECTLPKKFSGRTSILYRSGGAWYRVPVADLAL